jgi:S-DNA-T family DNA segregation ATPase FtsK/SpoIIIE
MPTAGSRRIDPRAKDDLWAIGALLAGLFLALATAPGVSLTGSVGVALGSALRALFGAGAAAVPLIPLFWTVALFGRLDRGLGRRVTILLGGLAIAVPFALGVGFQTWESVAHEAIRAGALPEYPRWVGLIGGFFAYELRIIGPVGEGLLALGAFSGLTIATVGWNPLGMLRRRERGVGDSGLGIGDSQPEPEPASAPEDLFAGAEEAEAEAEEERMPAKRGRKGGAPTPKPHHPTPALADELPPIDLLNPPSPQAASFEVELDRLQGVLIETLRQFKVEGTIGGRTTGPVVTQFEVIPAAGVKVGRIAALADDLALTMRAQSIRIVAPIPGKGAVGVEVPNPTPRLVGFRELLETPEWTKAIQRLLLPVALGRDLEGRPIIADLTKMPHLLIAGATGSGKSVCINTLITSLVYRYTPVEMRFLMIDPKMVELSMYNALPHLRHRVVTDNKDAALVFTWAKGEMQRRYELLHANQVRNVLEFNRKLADAQPLKEKSGEAYTGGVLPYVILIVDELADLIMTVQAEVETPLAILAQKARAIGIHLVLATQRPSVNVITGLIKANFPCRIAFRVASKVDSRTILDQNGAEALLGNGDMLFMPPGKSDLMRLQGAFVGTDETERLMRWFDAQRDRQLELAAEAAEEGAGEGLEPETGEPDILEQARVWKAEEEGEEEVGPELALTGERDPLFRQAAECCIQNQLGSTSLLQRRLKIGYGRAARIIDQLHDAGILGPPDGSKAREVLVGLPDLDQY